MGSKKRRVTAYLVDGVVESFDGFKQRHGFEADSQALNQILIQFFGLSEEALPSSDVLARLAEVEQTVKSLRGIGDAFSHLPVSSNPDEAQLGLPLSGDSDNLAISVPVKEVAKVLGRTENNLLRMMKVKEDESEYNIWLLAISSGMKVRYRYSMESKQFFRLQNEVKSTPEPR
jgi:hypothetical protein